MYAVDLVCSKSLRVNISTTMFLILFPLVWKEKSEIRQKQQSVNVSESVHMDRVLADLCLT